MRLSFRTPLLATGLLVTMCAAAWAAQNGTTFTRTTDSLCIASNGLPDHATGQFPNRGNPNSIRAQRIDLCVPATPKKGDTPKPVRVTGIATNGILIRPGTADYYDGSSPRGHSRNPASGWNLDAMGARQTLGLDAQNAHVDHRGLYHYHGVPPALVSVSKDSLIGYAADGFQIHYVGDSARPSYLLKSGTRPTAPGGAHDGTYNEDFEYVRGLGNLDQCNGAMVNGQYIYFATDAYPYYPRCLYGTEITRIR